jgi:epoxide hydrolase-like predicted phosphatase
MAIASRSTGRCGTPLADVITVVAFDFAGVVSVDPLAGFRAYEAELGLPDNSLAGFMRGDPQMARLEVGEISARDFLKYICVEGEARHGVRLDIRRVAAAVEWGQQLNPEMVALAAEVHDRCTTALLTNNVKEAVDWRGNLPTELFDHVIDSSAAGVRKPDPAIYQELLRRVDRPAEEVVFFDDFEENLPPAAALGITAIPFTGIEDCRKALTDLGVL